MRKLSLGRAPPILALTNEWVRRSLYSIEAASRSLQKVTPQNVDELISSIFEDRIKDGQLDESPLTVAEISKIKESFVFTLLNSLHSRIAYPKKEKESTSSTENGGVKSEVPNEESSLRP